MFFHMCPIADVLHMALLFNYLSFPFFASWAQPLCPSTWLEVTSPACCSVSIREGQRLWMVAWNMSPVCMTFPVFLYLLIASSSEFMFSASWRIFIKLGRQMDLGTRNNRFDFGMDPDSRSRNFKKDFSTSWQSKNQHVHDFSVNSFDNS